jgi:S1-C subfamily serine protease
MKACCPSCGSKMRLPDSAADARMFCPRCGTAFIPRLGLPVAKALPVIPFSRPIVFGAAFVATLLALVVVALVVRLTPANSTPVIASPALDASPERIAEPLAIVPPPSSGVAFVSAKPPADVPLNAEQIFAKCAPSMVAIATFQGDVHISLGSGFLVRDSIPRREYPPGTPNSVVAAASAFGSEVFADARIKNLKTDSCLVVTNYHVLKGGDTFLLRFSVSDPDIHCATRLRHFDADRDIAVLEVVYAAKQQFPYLEFARQSPPIGSPTFVIASPKGLTFSLNQGIVSARRRVDSVNWIQTSVGVAPGSSGAALLDRYGEVAGVVTSRMAGEGFLGLSIAHDEVVDFLESVPVMMKPQE